MRRVLIRVTTGLVAVLVIGSSCFTVDRAEYVYVTQLGKPMITYDGENDAELHWKLPWPIQSVPRLDHLLQAFHLPGVELPKRYPNRETIIRSLTISAYDC